MTIEIRPLHSDPAVIAHLAEILIATVAAGGSVTFMHPMPHDAAIAYWRDALDDTGNRIVLGGFIDGVLVGTVTLWLGTPQNQPFRAEIWKLMTHPTARRRGVACALMQAVEPLAAAHHRTLLTLDTAQDGGAAQLYESLGWVRVGEIPDFAYKPHGGLTATVLFYKRVAAAANEAPGIAPAIATGADT